MKSKTPESYLIQLALSAVMAALVFVATMIIRITIPATGGYFNVGDSMIYVSALLFGPFVGGLAGGIGASLVDVLGYPIFAPGTLIIKLVEGTIVGYVGCKIRLKTRSVTFWRTLSLFFGATLSVATYYVGANYMGVFGNALLDQLFWFVMALFLGVFIVSMSIRVETQVSWQTIAVILGGAEMVIGYFLYESLLAVLVPGAEIYAIAEIPLNIGQMLVGMTVALPIVKAVQRALPSLSSIPR
jgi:uncharacterized membrane protein